MKADNESFDIGKLKVWLDMSSKRIRMTFNIIVELRWRSTFQKIFFVDLHFGPRIKLKLLDKFVELQKSLLDECNYNPHTGSVPVKFNDPIYGYKEGGYLVFCIPGSLIT